MAKKRIKTDISQRGLFDIFDDPIAEFPVHSSIEDFIVDAPVAKQGTLNADELINQISINHEDKLHTDNEILFMSFGSGSSGNCAYVGTADKGGFLVDAGVDTQYVADSLFRVGISMDDVRGICLTHDHSDHVRFIYTFVKKYPHIRLYCTRRVLNGILRRHNISRRIQDFHKPINKEFTFAISGVEGFEITPFEVNHDGSDNCGFFIQHGNSSMAIATDLGSINHRVNYYMKKANFVMIESNYDSMMLKNGKYPAYLKSRISSDNGHLDNALTAAYLKSIISKKLTDIFLCHLSQDNNRPDIALTTVMGALGSVEDIINGTLAMPTVTVLPRFECSTLFNLKNKEIK